MVHQPQTAADDKRSQPPFYIAAYVDDMPWCHTLCFKPIIILHAVSTHCLCTPSPQEASVRGQLYMDTFRRLNLGLVLQTGVTLVVAAQAVSLRNPLLTGDLQLPFPKLPFISLPASTMLR